MQRLTVNFVYHAEQTNEHFNFINSVPSIRTAHYGQHGIDSMYICVSW